MTRHCDPSADATPTGTGDQACLERWFAERLLEWASARGRHKLPWQIDRNPYRVWLAEVMLQQTQANTVIPYFERFADAIPTLEELANASEDDVLALWTGLGYYRRAKNLHQAAQHICERFDGQVPKNIRDLCSLPGIGRSTAGAIVAAAYERRGVILDGNVRRVLSRFHAFAPGRSTSATERKLWDLADAHTPHESNFAAYNQAIMDLGATCCTRSNPACNRCPLNSRCRAFASNSVSDYPQTATRRASMKITMRFACIVDQHERLLMERRSQRGIWASLWMPLEVDHTANARSAAAIRLGIAQTNIEDAIELPHFEHVLTHRRVRVEPVLLRLGQHANITPSPMSNLRWVEKHQVAQLGVSKVTLKLVDAVQATLTSNDDATGEERKLKDPLA